MDLEIAYQMELHGDLPTRFGKINKVIQDMIEYIKETGNTNLDFYTTKSFLDEYNLYPVSYSEQNYIISEVNRGI